MLTDLVIDLFRKTGARQRDRGYTDTDLSGAVRCSKFEETTIKTRKTNLPSVFIHFTSKWNRLPEKKKNLNVDSAIPLAS